MLKNLVKIASDLDAAGFKKEADIVDVIIRRVASMVDDEGAREISEDDASDSIASFEDLEILLEENKTPQERAYDDVMRRIGEDGEIPGDPSYEDFLDNLARKGYFGPEE
jgi:hypothetical protein